MMQPAQDRAAKNVTNGPNGTWYRRILVQRYVRSSFIVIVCVRLKHLAKMPIAKYYNMIKAVASDRADEPFAIAILPW